MRRKETPGKAWRQTARVLLAAGMLSLVLAGCIGVPAMLQPASENAASVTNLTWVILGIAAFVFVVVESLIIFAAIRYRRRASTAMPKQIADNRALEIGWTAFPAVVLAVVFGLTLNTLFSITTANTSAQARENPNDELHVQVIGHQWWWEFRYEDLGVTTATELHVPVGTTLYLDVTSSDVIHSFWVPELGSKMDGIPGRMNHTWYKVTKEGRYSGQCSEFCGAEHALMRMQVVVESPAQFAAWVTGQQAKVTQPTDGPTLNGSQLFFSMACVTCHTISGTKATGKIGPDLTHFASRATFAGGAFDNTPENVASWITNPDAMKPETKMPNLGLLPDQAKQIAQFLESLK
jgi:cytochrome c oxidase subunit 2